MKNGAALQMVIAAGGTGGHIFPALAVAQALRARGVKVHWVGSHRGLEARVVRDQAGIELTELVLQGLRGRGLRGLLALPLGLMRSLFQSWRLLSKYQPSMVIVFGGYVSFPVGLIAWLQGRLLLVHEQNAVMGTANRWLARWADLVLISFAPTLYAPASAVCVGNPVRPALHQVARDRTPALESEPLKVLVIGGSLGARALNQNLPMIWRDVGSSQPLRYSVWHQTGLQDLQSVQHAYAQANPVLSELRVDSFIDDMAAAYSWADLVICRAGASTVAELTAVGLPAILVPLPNAIDDHQTQNAQALVQTGQAVIVTQTANFSEALAKAISSLSRAELVAMSAASKSQGADQALSRFLAQIGALWPAVTALPATRDPA